MTVDRPTVTRGLAWPALAGYILSVVVANYLTTHYGFRPVGFGLYATAGTYAIGYAIMVRDLLQDVLGRLIIAAAIIVAAAVSYAVADHHIAVASGVTFLVAELFELAVYTPLRARVRFAGAQWAGVVLVANAAGALVDTLLFLHLAGFPITGRVVAGQMVGKAWVTIAVITLAYTANHARRPAEA